MKISFFDKIFPSQIAYRNFIFIPVFFSFYIVFDLFRLPTFSLEDFTGRPISMATSEAIDIGKRVAAFYRAIVFASVLVLLFTRIVVMIRIYIHETELRILNALSLAGFCLMYFQVTTGDFTSTFRFLFALMAIVASGIVFKNERKHNRDLLDLFCWTSMLSVALFFIQWQVFAFAFGRQIFSLPLVVLITGIPFYVYFLIYSRLDRRLILVSAPLMWSPLLSFLCIEIFMIFNQHGVFFSPRLIYGIGLFTIGIIMFYRIRKMHSGTNHLPIQKILFGRWMPLLLCGILCVAFYNPVVTPEIDFFEDANHILPLHQWFNFGKMPFLNTFSSHALSDFGPGIFYSLLNGPDPLGILVYGFLMGVVIILVVYFFIYKITNDGFMATWFALAYPFTTLLIPAYFNLVPLSALAFVMLYERQSILRYTLFLGSIVFMIFWRIDLGLSTLVAGIGSLLFLRFATPNVHFERKNFFNSLGIIAAILLICFLVFILIGGKQVFVSMHDVVNYISSFQSYGLKDLAYSFDINFFNLYILLPSVVLILVGQCMFSIVRRKYSKDKMLFAMAVVFLGIFYFSNLQRGLVRHTLAEQWDMALTSFGYFIIAASVYLNISGRNTYMRFLTFFIAGTLVIVNYVYSTPGPETTNNFSRLSTRLQSPFETSSKREKINRIVEDPKIKPRYAEFNEWLNQNFSAGSTFLDFSNSAMLYYYTNRNVPNYFLQIPQSAHNEYLQERFIEDLKNYDIPVTVFASVPSGFWDNLDGIPNTLRHYRISEYIYRNYLPAILVEPYEVWVHKSKLPGNREVLISDIVMKEHEEAGKANSDKMSMPGTPDRNTTYHFEKPMRPLAGRKLYLKAQLKSAVEGTISLSYGDNSESKNEKQHLQQKIYPGVNSIFMEMNTLKEKDSIRYLYIQYSETIQGSLSVARVYEGDHYPDYLATIPREYNLKKIPFIWGTYDENFNSGKIQSERKIITEKNLLHANMPADFVFEPVEDRENGNYVLVNARVPSGKETRLKLGYGDENGFGGSFIFTLKNDTIPHDYLIRISAQYNWYKNDNRIITLLASDNDIEMNLLEILRGD